MGYESIAHEAEGRIGYDPEVMRARRIIVLVKSNWLVKKKKSRLNIFRKLKLDFNPFLPLKHYKYRWPFLLLVGYNI